jgi:hypothetical protein
VREYARNTLHLSLEPASAAAVARADSSGADDDEEESPAKKPTAAAAAAAAKKRAAAAAAAPKPLKRDPRFPSTFLLRKVHLPDEDPKKMLKKLKSKRQQGAGAAKEAAEAEAATDSKAPGLAKLTWEVIGDVGIASYNVRKNPLYAPAFKVMREGQDSTGHVSAEEEEAAAEDGEAAAAAPAARAASPGAKSKRGGVAIATPSKITPTMKRKQKQEAEEEGEEGAAETR